MRAPLTGGEAGGGSYPQVGAEQWYMNFHEKALFVKADVAALEIVGERNNPSSFALCFHPHCR